MQRVEVTNDALQGAFFAQLTVGLAGVLTGYRVVPFADWHMRLALQTHSDDRYQHLSEEIFNKPDSMVGGMNNLRPDTLLFISVVSLWRLLSGLSNQETNQLLIQKMAFNSD